jgi:hypothetical protein
LRSRTPTIASAPRTHHRRDAHDVARDDAQRDAGLAGTAARLDEDAVVEEAEGAHLPQRLGHAQRVHRVAGREEQLAAHDGRARAAVRQGHVRERAGARRLRDHVHRADGLAAERRGRDGAALLGAGLRAQRAA